MSFILSKTIITRTKLMLEHTTNLIKIDEKLCGIRKQKQLPRYKYFLLHIITLTFISCYLLILCLSAKLKSQKITDYFYMLINYQHFYLYMFELSLAAIKIKIYKCLKNMRVFLNIQFELLISDENDITLLTAWNFKHMNIHNVISAYIEICKITDQVNETSETITIFSIYTIMYYFTLGVCTVITLFNNDKAVLGMNTNIFTIYFFILFAIRFMLFVEPSYLMSIEAKRVRVLLSKFMCYTTSVGKRSVCQFEILKQLRNLEPSFTPLGLFTLNRSFITTVLGVIPNYLVMAFEHLHIILNFVSFSRTKSPS
ncbi:uncharacterized protein LOC133319496 [Danaus plexippus]|uniref:uncharacterized protein LOC133319496 n=1 Tax=Danaus plexippus TaxID=13037 RepID=UPI002AB22A56|nr:uncharacterized protein LOC133319496 [Danaus plexippus]